MKVILTEDVKGKGKAREIHDFPSGYAYFLIKNQQAVQATPENLKKLQDQIAEEERLEALHLEEMKNLKNLIESTVVEMPVNINQNGKVLGSVTTKMIAEALEETIPSCKIDKRKITFNLAATTLGEYHATVQLHRQVTATITFKLVQRKK